MYGRRTRGCTSPWRTAGLLQQTNGGEVRSPHSRMHRISPVNFSWAEQPDDAGLYRGDGTGGGGRTAAHPVREATASSDDDGQCICAASKTAARARAMSTSCSGPQRSTVLPSGVVVTCGTCTVPFACSRTHHRHTTAAAATRTATHAYTHPMCVHSRRNSPRVVQVCSGRHGDQSARMEVPGQPDLLHRLADELDAEGGKEVAACGGGAGGSVALRGRARRGPAIECDRHQVHHVAVLQVLPQ